MKPLILFSAIVITLLCGGISDAANTNATPLSFRQNKHLYLAQKALEVGDAQQAIEIIRTYTQHYSDETPAQFHAFLGRCYHQINDHIQAAKAFATALSLQPNVAEYSLNLATCYYLNTEYSLAGQQFATTYRLQQPSNPELLYQAAVAYIHGDNFAQAQQSLQQLITSTDHIKKSWQELLLTCQLELKQWQQAQQLLTTLLTGAPQHLPYWRLQAQLHLHQQAYTEAASAMEVIIRLQPPAASDLRQLAELYRYLQAPLRCAQRLQQLYDAPLTNQQVHEIATLYQQGFDDEQALVIVREGLQHWPNDQKLNTLQAQLLYSQRHYQQLVELHSPNHQTSAQQLILRGYAAWHLGLWQKAQQLFRQASSDQHYHQQAQNALEVLELLAQTQQSIDQPVI